MKSGTPIDLRQLGETVPVESVQSVRSVGLDRRDLLLLVGVADGTSQFEVKSFRDALSGVLADGPQALIVPERMLTDVRILTVDELTQMRDMADALLHDQEPDPLTPDRSKSAAQRVVAAMRRRPELYEAVAAIIIGEEARRRG